MGEPGEDSPLYLCLLDLLGVEEDSRRVSEEIEGTALGWKLGTCGRGSKTWYRLVSNA